MAKIIAETIWHPAHEEKLSLLAHKIGTEDEIIFVALKGLWKEYLFLTNAQVYIIKEGLMTGNFLGNGMFSLPYSQIATIEIKMNIGGVGFLEISASGVKNIERSFWNMNKSDPAKAPNCITIDHSLKKDFQMAVNKINELRSTNDTPQSGSGGSLDEIKKLKELLDIGAVTQEEYDAKKKKLLNL